LYEVTSSKLFGFSVVLRGLLRTFGSFARLLCASTRVLKGPPRVAAAPTAATEAV
jgi:hypothetical protein